MQRHILTLCLTGLALVFVLAPTPGFAANLLVNADTGLSERVFASNSKAGSDDVVFVWEREMPLASTGYAVTGLCVRVNENFEPVGNHTVIFKNLSLTGIDSGNQILLSRAKRRLQGGIPNDLALWDITEAVLSVLPEDDFVLVQGRITVKKKVAANNSLTCGLAVIEADLTGLESNSTSARLERFRDAAQRVLPRAHLP